MYVIRDERYRNVPLMSLHAENWIRYMRHSHELMWNLWLN